MPRHPTPTLFAALAVLSLASAGVAGTQRFDLTEAGLGLFGLSFNVDYITPVEELAGRRITATSFHLEFATSHPAADMADAADLAIDFQAPIEHIERILTVTGADFGFSGRGTFSGEFSSDFLNDVFLDFSAEPPGSFALWFARIYHAGGAPLGGQLTNSYIEVTTAPVPEPGALALALGGLALVRPRRAG